MKKRYRTDFQTRQYMLSRDYEIFYYSDRNLGEVALHFHDYYEFYFFLEGDVSIQLGDTQCRVNPGDFLLVPPGLLHRPIIHSPAAPYRRFVFWISQQYCDSLQALSSDYLYLMQHVKESRSFLYSFDTATFNGIQARLFRLIDETQSNRYGKEAQCLLCVNELILHLNRLIYDRLHGSGRGPTVSLAGQLTAYIENHLDEDLSLDHLAEVFYVSKYHISHAFKDSFGISLHQYITKKRLAQCREALLSQPSITDVYQSFGFGDYSSFYRAFRKEYGISPKDFCDSLTVRPSSRHDSDSSTGIQRSR